MSKKSSYYSSEVFSFSLKLNKSHTSFVMQMHTDIVTTKTLLHIHRFLLKNIPTVLTTECFNEKHISFTKEVCNTELGHLFEHMLLDSLLTLKKSQGISDVAYNGLTSWNWKRDTYGLFRIRIDSGKSEKDLMYEALAKTVPLFEACLLPSVSSSKHYPLAAS